MDVTTRTRRHHLSLATPFEISRSEARAARTVTTVELRDAEGTVGVGAAAPDAYYGDGPAAVDAALPDLFDIVRARDEPVHPPSLERRFADVAPASPSARAAMSIATHDLLASQRDEPLYRTWGLDPAGTPRSSFSVGIASPETMAERTREAVSDGFASIKVKLGTDDDRRRLRAVREAVPEAGLRVDANGAWSPGEAVEHCAWLETVGVELLEQPVPADDVAGLGRVRTATSIPVAVDEACMTAADVAAVADAADVVVVKLMKCGGVSAARRQIAAAHCHGLAAMLGCMVESAASIAPACHLAPLVEWVDLDGALLLAEDPYDGVPMPGGRIDLEGTSVPGTGVTPASPSEPGCE